MAYQCRSKVVALAGKFRVCPWTASHDPPHIPALRAVEPDPPAQSDVVVAHGAASSHTLRHLRLTDLARSGWDLHEIALFAGHRSTQTTLRYIHRSGRELAASLARTMADLHAWRSALTVEVLNR